MKKSLLLVLTLLLGFAVPQFSVAQNQNRSMFVHLKGETAPLQFDLSTIDSISFVQAQSLLTFEFLVENINMDGADFTIIPSDKKMSYFALYVPTLELKGKSDNDIITEYSEGIDESVLFQGDFSMTAQEVDMLPDTDYTLFAFGYQNGRPNPAGLFRTTFRTLSERPVIPGPEVKLWGSAGDKNGAHKDSYIIFEMQSSSQNVTYAECLIVEAAEIDKKIEEGYSLQEIAEGNKGSGYILDRKEMAMFMGTSFVLILNSSDGVKPNTQYACVLLAENWDGGQTVVRCDVQTQASQQSNVKPEIKFESWAGDKFGKNPSQDFTLKYICTTKNAAYCESFIFETAILESLGVSIEDLILFNEGSGRKMTMEELDKMNGDGTLQVWEQNRGATSYTVFGVVKNLQGQKTIFQTEVVTEPDGVYSVKTVSTGVDKYSKETLKTYTEAQQGVKLTSLK